MKSNRGFFAATAGFIKKYVYLILLFLCVAAIVTVIVVATANGAKGPSSGGEDPPGGGGEDPPVVNPMEFSLPVQVGSLGHDFSFSDFVWLATQQRYQTHKGIDFHAPAGTNVYAVYDGTVDDIYTNVLEGTVIVLAHQDGVKTYYKSLEEEVSVSIGDTVRTNDVIGKVSDSMLYEVGEGPHLHFEVWKNNSVIDPYLYLLEVEK